MMTTMIMMIRVSQKNKSSNFGMQLTPVVFIGYMSLQKKFQHYRPLTQYCKPFLVLHCNYNGEIGQKINLVVFFDWGVLLTQGQLV